MAVTVSSSVGVTPNQIVVPSKKEGNKVKARFLVNLVHLESRTKYGYLEKKVFFNR